MGYIYPKLWFEPGFFWCSKVVCAKLLTNEKKNILLECRYTQFGKKFCSVVSGVVAIVFLSFQRPVTFMKPEVVAVQFTMNPVVRSWGFFSEVWRNEQGSERYWCTDSAVQFHKSMTTLHILLWDFPVNSDTLSRVIFQFRWTKRLHTFSDGILKNLRSVI